MSDRFSDSKGAAVEMVEHVCSSCPGKYRPVIDIILQGDKVAEVKEIKGSEAYAEALLKERPKVLHPRSLILIMCCLLGFFCQTMNGFDGRSYYLNQA